jgi:hypothetical protein
VDSISPLDAAAGYRSRRWYDGTVGVPVGEKVGPMPVGNSVRMSVGETVRGPVEEYVGLSIGEIS